MREQKKLRSTVNDQSGFGVLVLALAVALLPFLSGTAEAAGPTVFINEFHYDNTGTDVGEGFEIAGPAGTALAGWSVVLYNGANGESYNSIALAGTIPDQQAGFGTLAFALPTNGLQNGSPDGLALFDDVGGLIEFLSYEGTFEATDGPAAGITSTDIGVTEPGDTLVGYSLQLIDSGTTGGDLIWAAPLPNTFGAENSGQTDETIIGVCGDPATLIHEIQGSGLISPEVDNVHEVEGVVVGDFRDNGQLGGFFLQEEDIHADSDPATSEGIFVSYGNSSTAMEVGDVVRVRGLVREFFDLTELTNVEVVTCNTAGTATPSTISLPLATVNDLEVVEGMAVTTAQPLYITELFNFGRFGEIILSSARQFQPTAVIAPGLLALEKAEVNSRDRIVLDDGRNSQNPDPAIHPNGNDFSLSNLFRGGDSVENITGVMDYRFDKYRIQPTQGAMVMPVNPRPVLPKMVGGSLTVASFNLQNYFSTLDDAGPVCGPMESLNCRGAGNANEFTRQRDKIISAIVAMDADIVALVEIENHPTDAALTDLVSGLNSATGAGTYAAIDTGTIGTDAIKVGLIYQPESVAPAGDFAVLDSSVDPAFNDDLNRPALAQTFDQIGTGAKFTAVVNHFKSKGSACDGIGDPDLGDGQGNCNQTRTAAAIALASWLATDPTASEDPDFLILGDLNAYDKEDPISALLAGGYTELLNQHLGEFAYSYVFDGAFGYLDYALANEALLEQVTGVTVWHINADEPKLIDYRTSFKSLAQQELYAPDAYRSSDHDPVLIGLDLEGDDDIDSDGDGVVDSMDICPDSDLSATVAINSCDSGVANQHVVAGCSIMDGINACPTDSQGELSSCVSHLTNSLKQAGFITGKQKGKIQKCAKLPKADKPQKNKKPANSGQSKKKK